MSQTLRFALLASIDNEVYAIFDKGALVPAIKIMVFFAARNCQTEFKIVFLRKEGERHTAQACTFSQDKLSPMTKGAPLVFTFEIDEHRILSIVSPWQTARYFVDPETPVPLAARCYTTDELEMFKNARDILARTSLRLR